MALGYGRVGTNNFSTAKYIVDGNGLSTGCTHTTIASALTSASSGETIFVRPGTYTEDLTLKAGVDIVSDGGSVINNNTQIIGKCSASFTGKSSILGIYLQTNGDYAIEISGTSATVVEVGLCYCEAADFGFCNNSSSSSSAVIEFNKCNGEYSDDVSFFTCSSPGGLRWKHGYVMHNSSSPTACAISAGQMSIWFSRVECYFAFTGSGSANWQHSTVGYDDLLAATIDSTIQSVVRNCLILAQTAQAFTVASGSELEIMNCTIDSNNATAVISGAGTTIYSNLTMEGTGYIISTTSQTVFSYNQVGAYIAKKQPCFAAENTVNDTNATGAGTAFTCEFDSEFFDQGGNYNNTTDTFTAPVTGKYLLRAHVFATNISSMEAYKIDMVTSNRTYRVEIPNSIDQARSSSITVPADMDVSDTAVVKLTIDGGAGDTATIVGSNVTGGLVMTYFAGELLC